MKLRRSLLDYGMEFLCLFTLIATAAYFIVMWPYIPEQIPIHFDGSGQIDNYGSKNMLLVFYAITWGMYLFLSFIQKNPASWNTGVKSGMQDKKRNYLIITHLTSTMKGIVVLIFTYITIQISRSINLGICFMWISIGAVTVNLIYWMMKYKKSNKR